MNLDAILIAAVGVFGTLASPIISQRLSSRAKREDVAIERSHRQDDRLTEQRQHALEIKRACYIAMVATSRRYRIELMNYLFKIKRGTVDSIARDELENARRPYIESMAETHLTASPGVLETIESVTDSLSNAYRAIKHLDDGEPEVSESFEELQIRLVELWDQWTCMRTAMRQDLGVED